MKVLQRKTRIEIEVARDLILLLGITVVDAFLADTIIELSSRTLLIGKMMKTKSTDSISLVDFEKIKNKLAEAHEKIKSLTLQVKEIDASNTKRETEKENLENKINELNVERLKNDEEKAQLCKENQLLKEKMLELSTTKETDKSTIQRMEKEIDRLKVNVFEAESFIMEQHQLGFDKALSKPNIFIRSLLMKATLMLKRCL